MTDSENIQVTLPDEENDKRQMKVAWIGGIVFHFLLFMVIIPDMGGMAFVPDEREEAVVIKRYKPPEPPKEQPKKKVVKKSAARVPIPDPTPDEPEPIVTEEIEFVEDNITPIDTDFVVGLPSAGPPVIETGPIRVGGDVQRPERIHYVKPEYPELARRARLEGVVIIQATIDKQGNVIDLQTLRGLGLGLDDAATSAAQQWKYTPTMYNGRPVDVVLTVTVEFKLLHLE